MLLHLHLRSSVAYPHLLSTLQSSASSLMASSASGRPCLTARGLKEAELKLRRDQGFQGTRDNWFAPSKSRRACETHQMENPVQNQRVRSACARSRLPSGSGEAAQREGNLGPQAELKRVKEKIKEQGRRRGLCGWNSLGEHRRKASGRLQPLPLS